MDRTSSQGPTTARMHKWSIFRLVLHTFWYTSRVSVGPIAVSNLINDLTHVIDHTNMCLFEDDMCLFFTVDNRMTASNAINDDLRAIHDSSDEWLVTFNAPKTKSIVVSLKRDTHLYPRLSLNNSVVSNHKHLGIVLSNYLDWANHVDEIYAKAMRRLDGIQSFKFKLDRNALELFCASNYGI